VAHGRDQPERGRAPFPLLDLLSLTGVTPFMSNLWVGAFGLRTVFGAGLAMASGFLIFGFDWVGTFGGVSRLLHDEPRVAVGVFSDPVWRSLSLSYEFLPFCMWCSPFSVRLLKWEEHVRLNGYWGYTVVVS